MPPGSKFRYQQWRAIVAISFGNALEWFDFVIFGYFIVPISKQFFPASERSSALMLSLATFGAAFLVRPLGAIVLGHYADRYGRKPALALTISLMTVGTALIAFAPTYQSAGLLAPITVIVARIVQGLSAGGEFGSSTTLLVEQDRLARGFIASWQFSSQALTLVFATSCGTFLSLALDAEQINAWGWRIPFVFGLLIGPIAVYVRSRIAESAEFQSIQVSSSPTSEIASFFKSKMLVAIGLVTLATVAIYTLVFMQTFCVRYLGFLPSDVFRVGLITGIAQVVLVPVAGALSDKWGRLPIAGIAGLIIMVTAIPLLGRMTTTPTFANLLLFQLWTGICVAIYVGPLPAMLSELFPTQVRTTGLSISYSLAVGFFGGFAPLINGLLINFSGSNVAPGYYLSAAALISLIALLAARKAGLR
ncbi:MAG TPA: MFS transporter [Pirellulales bacterium]|nr:MFS transporter [Pirellulales bacterium]